LYVFVAVMKFYYFFIFFQGPPVMTLEVGPPAPGALKGMERTIRAGFPFSFVRAAGLAGKWFVIGLVLGFRD
jgi:hypothetical protein